MSFMSHRPDLKMGQFLKSLDFPVSRRVGTKLCSRSGCSGSNVPNVFVRDCLTIFSLVLEERESLKDLWPIYCNDPCIYHESLPKEIPLGASRGQRLSWVSVVPALCPGCLWYQLSVLGVCGTSITCPTPGHPQLHFL